MSLLKSLPDNTARRLAKVIVRTIHLIGVAGFFGNAMMGHFESTYISSDNRNRGCADFNGSLLWLGLVCPTPRRLPVPQVTASAAHTFRTRLIYPLPDCRHCTFRVHLSCAELDPILFATALAGRTFRG